MPVDNSAATTAQSLLNGINYGAVIGAPLDAAVRAQIMAAQSTADFIQQVGFNEKKEVVNVTFIYQKDGEMAKLIVPLLSIVPIPALEITQVTINFKANINASASSSTETAESAELAGSLSGSAQVGWGPFSAKVDFSASVSSKSSSKATADSRYSVEYTQEVGVVAQQAGLPAGLATVLNILSNAATGTSIDGRLLVSPPLGTVNLAQPAQQQTIEVVVKDPNGLNKPDTPVTITGKTYQSVPQLAAFRTLPRAAAGDGTDPLFAVFVAAGPAGADPVRLSELNAGTGQTFKTDSKGKLALLVWLDPGKVDLMQGHKFEVDFSADVGGKDKSREDAVAVPFAVIGALPGPSPELKPGAAEVSINDTAGSTATITVTAEDASGPVQGVTVDAELSGDLAEKLSLDADSKTTGPDGTASFTVTADDVLTAGQTAQVELSASIDDTPVTQRVKVKAKADSALLAAPFAGGARLSVSVERNPARRPEGKGREGKRGREQEPGE